MQAILTKYLPPTNHRGARIRVICDAKTTTFSWDHNNNDIANHSAAAYEVARTLGWLDQFSLAAGSMPLKGNSYAYCFVLVPREDS